MKNVGSGALPALEPPALSAIKPDDIYMEYYRDSEADEGEVSESSTTSLYNCALRPVKLARRV